MPNKDKPNRKIDTQGGPYFEGNANTGGGDIVGGNQNKVNIGSVSNSTVTVGDYNTVTTGSQAAVSLRDLVGLVAKMRALLPQAHLDSDMQEVVEGSFKVVEMQLARPEPKKALVLPSLKQVAESLSLAAGAGEAVQKLAPMVQQAITWAQTLLK
jgi:hypothetical protein